MLQKLEHHEMFKLSKSLLNITGLKLLDVQQDLCEEVDHEPGRSTVRFFVTNGRIGIILRLDAAAKK